MLKFYVAETFSENYTARIFPELLRTARLQQCYKRRGSTTAFLHTKSHATGQNLPFCLLLANKNGGVEQKMAAKNDRFRFAEIKCWGSFATWTLHLLYPCCCRPVWVISLFCLVATLLIPALL